MKVFNKGLTLQDKIMSGVNTLADCVATTLGPRGRNVILSRKGLPPIITKDGVTVSNFCELSDPVEDVAVKIIKQAAAKTAKEAGDGTTTSTVLAREILRKSRQFIRADISPIEIRKGMDKAVSAIVNEIRTLAIPIKSLDQIRQIATLSSNGDDVIGRLVSTAVDQVGKDGAITIKESGSTDTHLEFVEGFRFMGGYTSSSFINDVRRQSIVNGETLILVTADKVTDVDDLLPILEQVSYDGRPFLIIAYSVEDAALAALIMNSSRGSMNVSAAKAPKFGDERKNILEDLAISIGATFVSKDRGVNLKNIKLNDLGVAKSVEISGTNTTIVGGKGSYESVSERIDVLKTLIKDTDSMQDAKILQERITRLASGVAVIHVGGATEVEVIERKHRIEDALEAVKSAQSEGVLPGGGSSLIRASRVLDDLEYDTKEQEIGGEIIRQSVYGPLRQIALNSGMSPDLAIATLEKESDFNVGINFLTGEVEDLIESGIIDPAKVTRCALINAASVASLLLTTGHSIIEVES